MNQKPFVLFYAILVVFFLFSSGCEKPQSEKQDIWNGEDFSGWTFVLAGDTVAAEKVWSVTDSSILCLGKPNGYMRTDSSFSDYKLHLEWRWVEEPGNSGVLLHIQGEDQVWPNCIECQLKSGNAGDIILMGPSRVTQKDSVITNSKGFAKAARFENSSEKPAGEWNTYEITCDGSEMTVYVNDTLQNRVTDVSFTKGPIGLQSEGSPIEFRNLYLLPLN